MKGARPIPVEVGQVRKGEFGVYWGVLKPHGTRKGFWLCASNEFPFDIISAGRHELESLPMLTDPAKYYASSGGKHPGISYWQTFMKMEEIKGDE